MAAVQLVRRKRTSGEARPSALAVVEEMRNAGMEIDPYDPETVAVYRLFNTPGALLYVGIARNPPTRFEQHAEDKFWWDQVARWTVEWFPNRTAAMAEESRAIVEEWPAYNVAGLPPRQPPADPKAAVRDWMTRFGHTRPTARDLEHLFLIMVRARSLGYGARLRYHPDAATAVYEHAYRVAGRLGRRRHHRFVDRWNDEHTVIWALMEARQDRAREVEDRRRAVEQARVDAEQKAAKRRTPRAKGKKVSS